MQHQFALVGAHYPLLAYRLVIHVDEPAHPRENALPRDDRVDALTLDQSSGLRVECRPVDVVGTKFALAILIAVTIVVEVETSFEPLQTLLYNLSLGLEVRVGGQRVPSALQVSREAVSPDVID